MLTTDLPTPARVLAVGAHPDDIEFGCGATLAKWAAQEATVVHAICTDGSKGTWDPDEHIDQLVARRQQEQREAAVALGADGTVEFLGAVDGELVADLDARRWLTRVIRTHRPEVILGHDPWKRYRLHPDHRAAGWLTLDAVVAARDPHFFPDLDIPAHRPSSILLFEADEANHVEVVDDAHLSRRCEALLAHRSQLRSTHYARLDGNPEDPEMAFRFGEREKLAQMGALAGVPLGEAFRLMDADA